MITRTKQLQLLTLYRWPIALCGVMAIAWADYLTGAFITLSAFYLAPLLLIAWQDSRRAQQAIIALIIVVWSLANIFSAPANYTLGVVTWNALVRWLHLSLTAELFHRIIMLHDIHKNAAEHDPLTGLLNRRGFTTHMHKLQYANLKPTQHMAFAIVDIDFFKQINDQQGHQFGDRVLQNVANTIGEYSHSREFTGRLGGDEFAFMWSANNADELQQRIQALSARLNSQAIPCSIGAVLYPSAQVPWQQLYEDADKALYQSKLQGRNQVTFSGAVAPAAG